MAGKGSQKQRRRVLVASCNGRSQMSLQTLNLPWYTLIRPSCKHYECIPPLGVWAHRGGLEVKGLTSLCRSTQEPPRSKPC